MTRSLWDDRDYAPGSIRDLEQKWLEARSITELRQAIYDRLPRVIAANDLEGAKPFLALERLVATAKAAEAVYDASGEIFQIAAPETMWQKMDALGGALGRD